MATPVTFAKFWELHLNAMRRAPSNVLVTGEIKLPYQKDGASPYSASVVSDARRKAARAGAKYFFT
jgi:hypothetical protein